MGLGNAWLGNGKASKAIDFYTKAIELDQFTDLAYLGLGNSYKRQHKFEWAIDCYQKAIESDASCLDAYYELGKIFQNQGDLEAAINYYSKAIKINRDDLILKKSKVHQRLGDIFKGLNRNQEAISNYKTSVLLDPDNFWIYKKLGFLLEEEEQYEEAVQVYNAAISISPDKSSSVYKKLGGILDQSYEPNEIVDFYQNKLKISSGNRGFKAQIYKKKGEIEVNRKNFEDAIKFFIKTLQIVPDYLEVYEALEDVLKQKGECIVIENSTTPSRYCDLPTSLLHEFCNLPKNWNTTTTQLHSSVKRINLYPKDKLVTTESKTIYDGLHPSLKLSEVDIGEAFVSIVEGGYAWGDQVTSVVMTPQRQVLTDLSTGCVELVASSNDLPPSRHISGNVAFLSVRWGAKAYFHWMFDILPRLGLISESGMSFNDIDKFVFNRCRSRFQIESLNLLGIPNEKIIESCDNHHIQADHLVAVSIPQLRVYRSSKWACDFLKRTFLNSKKSGVKTYPKRIYLPRGNASYRRVINENDVVERLSHYGFSCITLESMSLTEQAACLSNVEVLVASHGAALSNIVFCQPRTKIVEIFSPSHVQNTYWIISNVCNLDHYYLMSDDSKLDFDDSVRGVKKDIFVDLDALDKLLYWVL